MGLAHGGLTAAWLYAALSGLIPGSADNGGGFRGRERRAADPRIELRAGDTQQLTSLSLNTSRTEEETSERWAQDSASGSNTVILCTVGQHLHSVKQLVETHYMYKNTNPHISTDT